MPVDENRERPLVLTVGAPRAPVEGPAPAVALVRGPIAFSKRAINNEAVPAIGLAYIAGYLRRHGYEPVIVDAIGEGLNRIWDCERYLGYQGHGLTIAETVSLIPAGTRVIGFSAMFSGEWPVQRDLIAAVRARFPQAFLVAGGEHVTALPEYSLRDCEALDLAVLGEGEHTFFEVCEAIREGRDITSLNGVAFIDHGGRYVENSGVPRIRDVDNIPWPYWPEGYLEQFWQAGKSYGVQTERDVPILVSRGCPFRCTFCSSPQMWTTRYILRDVSDVIAEMKHYIARYNATAFQFYDLTAITKKSWAVEFCRRLIAEGIKVRWSLPSGTRSEALDEETLGLLRQTGCNYLVYAPESGSPRTLRLIKKQIVLDRLTQSALTAKKLGLVLRTNLIIGFPEETRADVFRTVIYGLRLAFSGVDEVSINIFSAYPGSEIFERLRKAGRVALNDAYFLSLTSLNSDYTAFQPLTFNDTMGSRELATYRIGFMLTNYAISYLAYPRRILRTVKNVLLGGEAATVMEHRLKDALARRRRAREAERSRRLTS